MVFMAAQKKEMQTRFYLYLSDMTPTEVPNGQNDLRFSRGYHSQEALDVFQVGQLSDKQV